MQHKTAIITGDVEIGSGVTIMPYAVIEGPCVIEDDVYIGAHACVGTPAQHEGSYPAPMSAQRHSQGVRVSKGACVREFVSIQQGAVRETLVGEAALVMAGSHVSHDSIVGNRATLSTFSVLGGFTLIDQDATFGQGVITHPWIVVGEAAMIGLNSSVLRDVLPYSKVAGSPARVLGTNTHKAPELPAEYEETILSPDVWDGWTRLLAQQAAARAAWRELHA
jgi:UDP-N-acetylglucosamine acyltransferase